VNDAKEYFQNLADQQSTRQNSLWMLGKLCLYNYDVDKAENYFKLALASDHISFHLLSAYLKFSNSFSKKIDQTAFVNFRSNSENDNIFLALEHSAKGEFHNAIINFDKLSDETKKQAPILFSIGLCYYQMRDYTNAKHFFHQCLELYKLNNHIGSEASCLISLGLIAKSKNEADEFINYLNTAIKILSNLDDWDLLQNVYANLGFHMRDVHDFVAAKDYFDKAIRISKIFHKDKDTAYYGFYFAQMLFNLRNFNEAIAACDDNEKYALSTNDSRLLYRYKIAK
jgi:tetratricopeptide (TPR) repeat protein